ncbi:hypothetical protein THARTR1_10515 [Trichoderma harzianum]|uniref:NADH dehydrogenase n=1 Tax=Trichoderma harzianum TaxID=5544 RepID=A0A2K0TNB0_TRIHA|nr:hypothetical protein THARTR1_10515 [Trichoderma harzianum]
MSSPLFWSQPLKYCAWAARERPAYFWSVVVGATGPALMPIVPPIRHMLGDVDPAPVPVTYPGTFGRQLNRALVEENLRYDREREREFSN